MLKAKKDFKRFSKKELKEDKFIQFTLQAQDWITENLQKILLAVLVLVAAIVFVGYYNSSKQAATAEAESLLSKAQQEMLSGQKESANAMFEEIITTYNGTNAAGKAAYFLAKSYWDDNKVVEAKQYYKEYVDNHGGNNILTQAALAGYANCLAFEKDFQSAASYYEKAANTDLDFPQSDAYLYSAAQAYYQAGNVTKARSLVEKVVDDSKNPGVRNQAAILQSKLSN